MYNFTNALNYDYERLISLPHFNGSICSCIQLHARVWFLCVCIGCYFVVLFESIFFLLFFFLPPQFVLIKLCKNPEQYHVHNCLNTFICLVLATICLKWNYVEIGCQNRKYLTFSLLLISLFFPLSFLPFSSRPFFLSFSFFFFFLSLSLFW